LDNDRGCYQFEGRTLTLRPGSNTLYPTVVLAYEPDTDETRADALGVVHRFLSALSWTERFGVQVVTIGGGGFPVQLGRAEVGGVTVLGSWRSDYLPEVSDKKARLGLALYRESLVLEHVSVPDSSWDSLRF
jgi:hypothetical protein